MQVAAADSGVAERLLDMLEKQQVEHRDREDTLRSEMSAQIEQLRADMAPSPRQDAVSQVQLSALQARLEALRVAELLADEEAEPVEDCIADFVELRASMGTVTLETAHASEAVGNVVKLVALSEGIEVDRSFARQLRRKLLRK